ncbi:MAG: trehalose-phosphatase [Candidatus Omnitrophica bacterium]|nr:trehalose-phosphatase [Candidatus Omnitrophota bacterium]
MRHLIEHLDDIEKKVKASELVLFLDYDGTLTPIVDKPEKAVIPAHTRKILKELVACGAGTVAVVSGRALADVKRAVGVNGIIYAGAHGMELSGPKLKFQKQVPPAYKKVYAALKSRLHEGLKKFKGAFVEDKGTVLTVHYRLLNRRRETKLKTFFRETVLPHVAAGQVCVKTGKKVLEVKPAMEWDKGKVVLWLLARKRFSSRHALLPVYIGDDVTDEDAFKALGSKGLTIFVGTRRKSHAAYYLKSYAEVQVFLEWLLQLKCDVI